jgi:hypothetical protein
MRDVATLQTPVTIGSICQKSGARARNQTLKSNMND